MKNGAKNQTAMRLHEAVICLDCETVYSSTAHRQCPSCASRASMPLARIFLPTEGSLIVPKPLAPKSSEENWDEETEASYVQERYFSGSV